MFICAWSLGGYSPSWWQEGMASGHDVTIVKKQRPNRKWICAILRSALLSWLTLPVRYYFLKNIEQCHLLGPRWASTGAGGGYLTSKHQQTVFQFRILEKKKKLHTLKTLKGWSIGLSMTKRDHFYYLLSTPCILYYVLFRGSSLCERITSPCSSILSFLKPEEYPFVSMLHCKLNN